MLTIQFPPVSTKETWQEQGMIVDYETGDPIAINAATDINVTVTDSGGSSVLVADLTNGKVTILGDVGVFQWQFDPTDLSGLACDIDSDYSEWGMWGSGSGGFSGGNGRQYSIGLLVTLNSITTQVFLGTTSFVRGIGN
jgi:hypothetical protein